MAYDAARGRLVLFGGINNGSSLGDTWEWSGTTWEGKSPATSPSARDGHAMAYDSARGRVVLFGGYDGSGYRGDTWEWDGTTWTEKTPVTSPSARTGHAMAYDSARGRVLLFGGYSSSTGYFSDTWEWDGSTWVQRTPSTSPSARDGHAMAYDAARRRVVLFGGYAGGAAFADTWEWDGTAWVDNTPATSPRAREFHAMAYDAARQRTVLFGGGPDTWEWEGTAWTLVATTGPPWRYGNSMAYDSARQRTVLFGGADAPNFFGDTWEWDGTAWVDRTPAISPLDQSGHAMAYDAARGRVVLFGGLDGSGGSSSYRGETWEWDGNAWAKKSPVTSPSARYGHAMAYDSTHGRVVLFGGVDDSGLLDDTWEWDGTTWADKTPDTGPPAQAAHAMAYDSARGRVVLFGTHGIGTYGTWEWDGTTWVQRTPATSPPDRSGHAMAYDSARGRVVLFGGVDDSGDSGDFGDTWEWDGTAWTQRTTSGPSPRDGHAMAYDSARGRVVLFGGYDGSGYRGDTWEWDGTTWTQRATSGPSPRDAHAMAYDSARGRVVLFGGYDGSGVRGDTWEYTGGGPICGADTDCYDNNPCTNDTCQNPGTPTAACLHASNTLPCDDGNACTTNDACSNGLCVGGPPPDCNDGDFCTDDACDPNRGCIHFAANCDDNNPCTNDSCDPRTGCAHVNNTNPCDDHNPCTRTDTCQNRMCIGSNPVTCTASDQCHDVGVCRPVTGLCTNPSKPDGTACDDGNGCTQTDTCQNGTCTGANLIPACEADALPQAPPEGTVYNPDSSTATFTWSKGSHLLYRVEWSSTATFGSTVVIGGGFRDADNYTPSQSKWLKILKLGLSNGTIHWRVRTKDNRTLSASPSSQIQLAAAQAAAVSVPGPGAIFSASDAPPEFSWATNHNSGFRIICSASQDFSTPKFMKSGLYAITTGAYTPTLLQWKGLYNAVAKNSQDHVVYFAIEAKDVVGRESRSEVGSFVLNP